MRKTFALFLLIISLFVFTNAYCQEVNDVNTPLHLMKPQYVTPYGLPSINDVKSTTDRVLFYLEKMMPAEMEGDKIKTGSFRLTSYEMGVLYCAVSDVSKRTGDDRYSRFAADRLGMIARIAPQSRKHLLNNMKFDDQMRKVCFPTALDDAGSMCTSFIRYWMRMDEDNAVGQTSKKEIEQKKKSVIPVIERYIDHVYRKQYRLSDGILARIRPHYNTVWLDDMYMGIPCLAWYGKLTGKTEYYDEAIKQISLFKQRMWVPEKKLFRHGWVEEMSTHPCYPWGRANGWAILTLCEVLDVLPIDYPGRDDVLDLLRQHIEGLCSVQDKTGFWHQLLDRSDTYLETSATAIYAYCIAHAICEGWIDSLSYGAQAILAWNATSSKVNDKGQVEGTCVGSGMGFDPAFYAYRPVHVMAAHGYGPVIWAGGEIIRLIKETHPKMNDSALHFYPTEQKTSEPIFSEQREGVEEEKVLW